MDVLDLASGSGEPALPSARLVGPHGHVTATDASAEMLLVAEENARSQGLNNLTFRQMTSEELPFPDESFDAVTCRLGLMFFPDPGATLGEIRRVLRKGGHAAFLTWGPTEQNPRFATTFGVLERDPLLRGKITTSELFRYDSPESLASSMREGGFSKVSAAYRTVPFPWDGPVDEAWECFSDLSAPFMRAFAQVPVEDRERVTRAILDSMRKYYDGSTVKFTAKVVLGLCSR
jgi:ubiquinone/menaquinone biosynthesis C-methylase UbiE